MALQIYWNSRSFQVNANSELYFQVFLIKIKMFRLSEKYFAIVGINARQSTQQFNKRNLTVLCAFGLGSILCGAYLFDAPSSFVDYAFSVFATSAVLTNFIELSSNMWNKSKLFEFIQNVESTVQKSESFLHFVILPLRIFCSINFLN